MLESINTINQYIHIIASYKLKAWNKLGGKTVLIPGVSVEEACLNRIYAKRLQNRKWHSKINE